MMFLIWCYLVQLLSCSIGIFLEPFIIKSCSLSGQGMLKWTARGLKYLDCIHKVYVVDQLRILLSMFSTQDMCVCTSVVIECWWCLQTLL